MARIGCMGCSAEGQEGWAAGLLRLLQGASDAPPPCQVWEDVRKAESEVHDGRVGPVGTSNR